MTLVYRAHLRSKYKLGPGSKHLKCSHIFSDLIISATHTAGPESFVIDIESDRINKLMEVFQGDFFHLANHLKLMNDRMVLVNPKF